jgi:hypothetical protein
VSTRAGSFSEGFPETAGGGLGISVLPTKGNENLMKYEALNVCHGYHGV